MLCVFCIITMDVLIQQLEKERENQLREKCSGVTNLPNNGSKGGTRSPKGSA